MNSLYCEDRRIFLIDTMILCVSNCEDRRISLIDTMILRDVLVTKPTGNRVIMWLVNAYFRVTNI